VSVWLCTRQLRSSIGSRSPGASPRRPTTCWAGAWGASPPPDRWERGSIASR
jgi:hypothetical protein